MSCYTEIWIKPKYTRYGIREIVRIVYNPYDKKPKDVIKFWIPEENQHKVYAFNTNKEG